MNGCGPTAPASRTQCISHKLLIFLAVAGVSLGENGSSQLGPMGGAPTDLACMLAQFGRPAVRHSSIPGDATTDTDIR